MLDSVPWFVAGEFILVALLTLGLFHRAIRISKTGWVLISLWVALQSGFAYVGFYQKTDMLPPRFILVLLPAILVIAFLFRSNRGKRWIASADVPQLTLLHIVRIPVELILYQLFVYGTIPELMTFAGRNFDILAGITAPLVYYFGYQKQWLSRSFIISWHIISLLLLGNIVVHAILSIPSPFQQLAFDQPNIAILTFPFVLLPGLVVPIVLFSHLIALSLERNPKIVTTLSQ
ncbi:MAG: hypothetical protein AAF944_15205 [Bacteroidota bacterium]